MTGGHVSRAFRILAASALLVLGLMAVASGSASATTTAACVFTGVTGSITPNSPPNTGIQNWQYDFTHDLNVLDIDTGTYTFDGDAQCTGGSTAPRTQFTHARIHSAGTYTNIFCGTGAADDPGNTTLTTDTGPDATGVKYHIDFTSGVGTLVISGGTYDGQTIDHGAGVVHIVPWKGNCSTTDVTQFRVAGGFELGSKAPPDPHDTVNDLLPPGIDERSALCDPATVSVIDTPIAGGYLRLEATQNGTTSTWVCVRVVAGGERFGGRFIVAPLAGVVSTDTSSDACASTPGNLAPGPHPVVGPGTIAGEHVMLDTWARANEVWICAELDTQKARIRIPTSGGPGPVTFERDP